MLGVKSSASSRALRLCLLGVATVSVAVTFTLDTADARRRHRHRSHAAVSSYSPAFSSIIVDANSGNTLQATSADSLRHPASLTKIMTLYMLFERLESGKMKLDTPMDVSAHASQQAPTKLGLRPGQTLRVEDAIKGLVTRSANDAAVVIAESIAGDEDDFAKAMTRKARALGMSKTVYKNASGLPDSDQVTTARDQATLGRAIQDRFPKYYRYFATEAFNYKGRSIRNHNKLLGRVEGVDGIKTGYTRASGFNLVTSMKRGNRYVVGVVMGGRSGGSRDAIMRNLLAENLDEASTRRTVAAITERGDTKVASVDDNDEAETKVEAKAESKSKPAAAVQVQGAIKVASTPPEAVPLPAPRAPVTPAKVAEAQGDKQDKPAPAPLTSGVISSQTFAAIPGSAEPMTPVRVKTVQVRMGQTKVASAAQGAPAPVATSTIPAPQKAEVAETSKTVVAKAETKVETRAEPKVEAKTDRRAEPWPVAYNQPRSDFPAPLPAQPNTSNGIGQGIIGSVPTPSSSTPHAQTMAYADPGRGAPPTTLGAQAVALQTSTAPQQQPAPQPVQQAALPPAQPAQTVQHNGAIKTVARSGWIIQVGALETESEARQRLDAARGSASRLLSDADPFTETVSKGNKTLYRARFAGLNQDSAEAACRTLKRSDISCIAIRN
ncbi:MAG: serine hydrolase [Pseudomonadota bacterium]|nr:SPOR domain-containing protein [Afipia sp.]